MNIVMPWVKERKFDKSLFSGAALNLEPVSSKAAKAEKGTIRRNKFWI